MTHAKFASFAIYPFLYLMRCWPRTTIATTKQRLSLRQHFTQRRVSESMGDSSENNDPNHAGGTLRQRKAKREFRGALVRIPSAVVVQEEQQDHLDESTVPSTGHRLTDKLYEIFQPSELKGPTLWKAAVLECFGSAVLTFVSSCSVITSVQSTLTFPPLAIAVFNGLLLTLIIYGTAAPSGGHVNPLITISTLLVGLTSPMRALLYVPAQMMGSAIGSFFFRSGMAAWGESTTARAMAGCVLGPDMSLAQAFCLEVASSFFIFIVAFGCALDPSASRVYGPIYAPVLIGVAVGLVIFGTSALFPGYTGAGVNPARCFGPTLISWDGWEEYWIVYFLGPLTAAIGHAPIYLSVPPDHATRHAAASSSMAPGLVGPDESLSMHASENQNNNQDEMKPKETLYEA